MLGGRRRSGGESRGKYYKYFVYIYITIFITGTHLLKVTGFFSEKGFC